MAAAERTNSSHLPHFSLSVVVLEEPPAEVFPEEQEPKEEATKRPEKVEKAVEEERREGRPREHRKAKKTPPKKLQKLHNLTGDLLFQVL